MTKSQQPKITICPSPARQDYKPDLAWRLAQQRAERDQPRFISLASNVPSHRVGEGLK
jgi:hypothetical protein